MAGPTYLIPTETPGVLRIMACPSEDVAVFSELSALGVTDVLSMLGPEEAAALGMGREGDLCAEAGMGFANHGIPDFGLPDPDAFLALIKDIRRMLRDGRHLAVHCRAGIGRSGMVAAATLLALGSSSDDAIATVSRARGVSIPDTVEQGEFIASFARAFDRETYGTL